MITEDQTATIEFFAAPATHDGSAVERIDTHGPIVFVAGTRAWKLKRAARYDYLDFSTAERRKAMCEAEVRVNRRIAPVFTAASSLSYEGRRDLWRLAARAHPSTGSSK